MMKPVRITTLLLAIAAVLLMLPCESQAKKRSGLRTRPERCTRELVRQFGFKCCTEWIYEVMGDTISACGRKNYDEQYDKNGDVVEKTWYMSSGEVLLRYRYRIENGILVETETHDEAGKVEQKWVNVYDREMNRSEKKWLSSDGSADKVFKYSFDKKGNMIEERGYSRTGELTERRESRYDEPGNEVERVNYSADGAVKSTGKFVYDSLECLVKASWTFSDNTFENTITVNRYDAGKNLIDRVDYDHEKKIKSRIFTRRNAKGLIIEESFYGPGGQFEGLMTRRYDENGILSEKMKFNSNRRPERVYRYTYDLY